MFNDQRLVMTVNVGSITPSATYNKGMALIVASVGKSSGNAVETQSNSQLWTGRNPVGWSGITSGNQPRAGDVTGNTSTAWALDDSGTAGIWVCGGWIGRDETSKAQMRGKSGVMPRTTSQRAKAPRCVIVTRKQCPAGCGV